MTIKEKHHKQCKNTRLKMKKRYQLSGWCNESMVTKENVLKNFKEQANI